MIVISAGMQKSGSAYFYNIINALLVESGQCDARRIRGRHGLDGIMQWHNNNIGRLSLCKLFRLWRISNREGTFVVKTHDGPKRLTHLLGSLGMIKIVYCYRDPRDVLISAVDHGKKILESGQKHTFANMVDFDIAMATVQTWLRVWKKYADMPCVLTLKYEDMMEKTVETTRAIEAFLDISVDPAKREDIPWKFSRDNPGGDRTGMHFNKAKIYRYKTEMTSTEKARCQTAMGTHLAAMGYEPA